MQTLPKRRARAKKPYDKEQAAALRKQRVQRCTERIVARFEAGDLPDALAPIFLKFDGSIPCHAWSWRNRLIVALEGYDDARSFQTWKSVGRSVNKGERAFYILEPARYKVTDTDKDTGETTDKYVCRGFKPGARFGYEQTDGDALPEREAQTAFIDALPLNDVAQSWGLKLSTFNATRSDGTLGWYRHGSAIAVGVENLSTWAHELVHAADFRLGTIEKKSGQILSNEVVAELGGAVVLTMIGRPDDADVGGCFEYLKSYCDRKELDVSRTCMQLLDRICNAVKLILDTSVELASAPKARVA